MKYRVGINKLFSYLETKKLKSIQVKNDYEYYKHSE
jgi:hypothetical protein